MSGDDSPMGGGTGDGGTTTAGKDGQFSIFLKFFNKIHSNGTIRVKNSLVAQIPKEIWHNIFN